MYVLTIIIRLAWSISIGMIFFAIGLILFVLLDVLMPSSDKGYKALNYMYKYGSLGVFKGLRLEQDNFAVNVEKKRKDQYDE